MSEHHETTAQSASPARHSTAPAKTGEMQFISFKCAGEEFGVEIGRVKEILRMSAITPVPRAPDYLLGMMNLRGIIIPVLDLKHRLGQGRFQATEKTRILVLSITGGLSGIVVDEVSQVQRIDMSTIEPPPKVTRGIDRFYLESVAKIKGQQRLVMMLNLNEVLNVEILVDRKTVHETTIDTGRSEKKDTVEEEHLAIFFLGDEEFGIDISVVKEMLRLETITAVPNVPDYVKGIQDVRDTVLPIIELRRLVNMDSLDDAHHTLVERLRQGHHDWVENLKNAIYKGTPFTKATDPTKCELGRLLEDRKAHDIEFLDMYRKFQGPHGGLHNSAIEILKTLKNDKDKAIKLYEETTLKYLDILMHLFDELKMVLDRRAEKEQRVLITDIAGTTIGLLVDRVHEVVRLPVTVIDNTPAVVATYGKEIKSVAKLENGSRLILLMDETALLSGEEIQTISQIRDQQAEQEEEEEEEQKAEIQERQVVVFSVSGEEFAIDIKNVQEIFRTDEITMVPKAPVFIKGVTNLRGSIIPVVDVKERFGVASDSGKESTGPSSTKETRLREEETEEKILVTLIKDTTVGLLVDTVHEVLRLSEDKIEPAPSLVLSNLDTSYLEGIAKLDDGHRIVLLLNIAEIMSNKEFLKLGEIHKQHMEALEEKGAKVKQKEDLENGKEGKGKPKSSEKSERAVKKTNAKTTKTKKATKKSKEKTE